VATAAGGALRLLSPSRLALWRDEAQYTAVASLPDPAAILAFLYRHESHPPLFYLLGHAAYRVFGSVEAPMEVLVLLASVSAIPLVYHAAASASSRVAGCIAAVATAFSVPLMLTSVQLRPYSLLTALLLVSCYGLWRFIAAGQRGVLVAWAAATTAALYTHYMAILVVATQAVLVWWYFLRDRRMWMESQRPLVVGASAVALAWIPGAIMFAHQLKTAGYPVHRPIVWNGPWTALLRLMLDFPFELLLPALLSAAGAIALLRGSGASGERGRAQIIMGGMLPVFLVLAAIASYRSAFLVPQVLIAMAPFGFIHFGSKVASLLENARTWQALVWLEGGVALACLSFLFSFGFSDTTADIVARGIAAEANDDDLIVLSPGAAGVSFNRTFDGPNSQINFPYSTAITLYPFDHDFVAIASPEALREVRDSMRSAFEAGRRVWFVSDWGWINDYAPAPEFLKRDSVGGIGQADRARANLLFRQLRWLYGAPALRLGAAEAGRGPEHLAAWLFESRPPRVKLP
jgi:hypothetical protein